jgi:hypothetical protein
VKAGWVEATLAGPAPGGVLFQANVATGARHVDSKVLGLNLIT